MVRALPAAFVALVGPGGRVADIGHGPGHLTTHLTAHRTEWLGHPVDAEFHLRRPALVTARLADAGLEVRAELVRRPEPAERADRASVLARRVA